MLLGVLPVEIILIIFKAVKNKADLASLAACSRLFWKVAHAALVHSTRSSLRGRWLSIRSFGCAARGNRLQGLGRENYTFLHIIRNPGFEE